MDPDNNETKSFLADYREKGLEEKRNTVYRYSALWTPQWKCSNLIFVVILLLLGSNIFILSRLHVSTTTNYLVRMVNKTTDPPEGALLCDHPADIPSNNATLPLDYSWTDDSPSGIDRSWCPKAVCHNSPICKPCQRRFLMVITNGRSASTTLTWTLDLLPGLRMAGENNNAIQHIKDMIDSIFSIDQMKVDTSRLKDRHGAWYHNPIPAGALGCVSQHMIETIVPPMMLNSTEVVPDEADEIIGFKTIRLFGDNSMDDVPAIVDFLNDHFPCTRYIVNHRSDLQDQAKSQLTAFGNQPSAKRYVNEAVARLDREVQRMLKFAELMGDRATVIDSSKWTQDVGHLNEAVRWLGFNDKCEFSEVLELNTKNGYGTTGTTNVEIDPECRYVGR